MSPQAFRAVLSLINVIASFDGSGIPLSLPPPWSTRTAQAGTFDLQSSTLISLWLWLTLPVWGTGSAQEKDMKL